MAKLTKEQAQAKYEKLYTALKWYLLGKNFLLALAALEFARNFHSGKRKDDITPEFFHQIEIAFYLITLSGIQNIETVLVLAILHDVAEDYDVDEAVLEQKFGKEITRKVLILSKTYKGHKKSMADYFEGIANDIDCSLVKGADRINNVKTMVGVFSKEKQLKYVEEVEQLFLPMLKKARNAFPSQMQAYFNIIQVLKIQIDLVKEIHKG